MQVKVLPCDKFGLVHGKAGMITLAVVRQTCFMGRVNKTYSSWKLNYELVWEDEAPEAIQWVQDEFEALWHSPFAVPVAEFVITAAGRLAQRTVTRASKSGATIQTPPRRSLKRRCIARNVACGNTRSILSSWPLTPIGGVRRQVSASRDGGAWQNTATGHGRQADGTVRHQTGVDPGTQDAALAMVGRGAAASGHARGGMDGLVMGG
jgi:hypothetical protein